MDLKNISTAELVRELSNREGVENILVEPYQPYCGRDPYFRFRSHCASANLGLTRVSPVVDRQLIKAPETAASHHFGDLRCLCPHSDPKSALKFSTNHRDNDYTGCNHTKFAQKAPF